MSEDDVRGILFIVALFCPPVILVVLLLIVMSSWDRS